MPGRWSEAIRLADPCRGRRLRRGGCGDTRAPHRSPGSEASRSRPGANSGTARWETRRRAQVIVTMFTIMLLIVAFVVVGVLGGRPRGRAAPSDRAAQGRRLHSTPGRSRVRAGVGRARRRRGRSGVRARSRPGPAPRPAQHRDPAGVADDRRRTRGTLLVAGCVVLPRPLRRGVDGNAPQAPASPSSRRKSMPEDSAPYGLVISAPRRCAVAPSADDDQARRSEENTARARTPRASPRGRGRRDPGAVVVAALSLDATLDARSSSKPSDFPHELLVLVYTLDAVLLLITATTLAAVALLSRPRASCADYRILKAIVAPRQIVSTVVSSNLRRRPCSRHLPPCRSADRPVPRPLRDVRRRDPTAPSSHREVGARRVDPRRRAGSRSLLGGHEPPGLARHPGSEPRTRFATSEPGSRLRDALAVVVLVLLAPLLLERLGVARTRARCAHGPQRPRRRGARRPPRGDASEANPITTEGDRDDGEDEPRDHAVHPIPFAAPVR